MFISALTLGFSLRSESMAYEMHFCGMHWQILADSDWILDKPDGTFHMLADKALMELVFLKFCVF
jgi:hypothetical protein